jgi:PEGA domain-containing protein
VSSHKRFLLSSVVAVLVVAGCAATSDAQVFRGRGRASRVVVLGGYYYAPFWIDPWYGPDYQWGMYPMYRPYNLVRDASVKLDVSPKQAEVYIDGYYAGIVDDFDGAFQRLHVEPGEHEIELYLAGYRTVKQKVYLTADNTFKVKYTMEKLAAGEQAEPRPQPVNEPGVQGGQPPMPPPGYPPTQPRQRGPVGRRAPQPPQPPQGSSPRGGQPQSGYGTLSVRVQPGDAEISIDGEAWRGPAGQDRLTVELSEGSHTIEIRKSGFRTYVTQVDIRRGETTPLNVSLRGDQ